MDYGIPFETYNVHGLGMNALQFRLSPKKKKLGNGELFNASYVAIMKWLDAWSEMFETCDSMVKS